MCPFKTDNVFLFRNYKYKLFISLVTILLVYMALGVKQTIKTSAGLGNDRSILFNMYGVLYLTFIHVHVASLKNRLN